ncbi:MAG TPA: DinB family protein [Acidimicrobiales bacterium]
MKRIEIESKLNESRNWLMATYADLTDEQLRRPVTTSEHDASNSWSALDHFAHLSLIEDNFVAMIRRQLSGHTNPVGLLTNEKGETRSREQIMDSVNAMTEQFQQEHRNDSLSEVVSLTARSRAASLALLAELSDDQLSERLEGAPWADGTIGGVLGVNADHARTHWNWVTAAGPL